MKMLDVNILIYAHRQDECSHAFYQLWLERLVGSGTPFAISSLVGVAFVRIVTHPRFHGNPTPVTMALDMVDRLRQAPGCRWLLPGERHWAVLGDLCRRTGAQGKLVADAQHAAVAIEHGCQWVTRDRDFGCFEAFGLDWQLLEPD